MKEPTEINWHKSEVFQNDNGFKVTRYGVLCLKLPSLAYTSFCPKTRRIVCVKEKVPVTQSYMFTDGHSTLETDILVDFNRLYEGEYEWESYPIGEGPR